MGLNLSALQPKRFEFSKREPISMTPIGGTQTTTPERITPITKPKLNISALTQPIKRFFEPVEKVRVRDVLREAGILTQKVVKAVTPTEEDIVDKEDFDKRGVGITRFGEIAFRNPRTGKITYMDTLGAVGKIRNVAKEGIEKVAKEFTEVIKRTKLDKRIVEVLKKPALETRALREVKPLEEIFKAPVVSSKTLLEAPLPTKNVPAVVQGETFTLGRGELVVPTQKELKNIQKLEIKAIQKEIKLAEKAQIKAEKLDIKQQKVREDTIANIDRQHGNTGRITESLKKKNLSVEDIDNVILEDGTKLTDTVKIKRNRDKTLGAVLTKEDISSIGKSYTGTFPKNKWIKSGSVARNLEKVKDLPQIYELPAVFFKRKGLDKVYDPMIEAARGAETLKTSFIKRFKDAGLWKKGGWFTADRFNISKKESKNIGQYFLARQNKGYSTTLAQLTEKEREFVRIFDNIIKETEPRFYEVARKNGKTPGAVRNYAPIMTRKDIELAEKSGTMDFITRKHPAFFSLKERAKKVPVKLYETDYRIVASAWLDGITQFMSVGDVAPEVKYMLDSDQFAKILNEKDLGIVRKWFQDTMETKIPETAGGRSVDWTARLLKKGVAVSSLGLNYTSVVKQALTQIPLTIIEKAPPKLKSQYAKAFGINVSDLPSISKRSGDIAITDLQGKLGRVFTGALTEFDRKNAQVSLNALLDKEYNKFLRDGAEITPEIKAFIEKTAQDKIDLWYGGFFSGQKPEAFRSSLGQFINMFIYPLTSQLNGFYQHILKAQGVSRVKAVAEVMAAATSIAYLEVAITNLSPRWSDEKEMTKDVLQSLAGNIPIVSQIAFAALNDKEFQVSAGVSGITNLLKKLNKGDKGEFAFATAELFGLPKQIRRVREGMEIIEKGGITDKSGKVLAPVTDTDEMIRSFLRGKYGSNAAKDWIRNIGEKTEDRRWFVPQVEFLQNGDYDRKAEIYNTFTPEEQKELRSLLSETQQKKLDKALGDTQPKGSLEEIFGGVSSKKSLEDIFK